MVGSNCRFPVALLQERVLDYGEESAESLPHGIDRTGVGAEGGAVDPGLAELVVDQVVRWLSILHERDLVREVCDARVKDGWGGGGALVQ